MAKPFEVFNCGDTQLPELRIVLIGGRRTNEEFCFKSSAGNIILGQSVFDTSRRTAQTEAQQQEVFGRRVTVVDTPGWRWFYPREDSPKMDQIEIQNSVHLCPPGPHVFLLVVPVGLYLSHIDKLSLKQHLELFNTDVLNHTILLFTASDQCSDEQIESEIRRRKTLQWIFQQCGNRKHVLNIRNMEDRAQVKMLFKKIDEMVAGNRDRNYSVDRADGNALREEMKALGERASKRFDQVQEQRRKLRALIKGGKVPPEHLRLVINGVQRGGKSSAGNTILGKNAFNGRNSSRRTTYVEMSHSVVFGRRVTMVDSPGWFYKHSVHQTSEMDKLEIESSVYQCLPGPHAVLLVIDLTTAMNDTYLRSIQEHINLFRQNIWKHTIVLFTMGDWLGVKTVEEFIESDEGLQWIVNKCENRYHVLNNMDHSDKTQVKELLEKIEEMWAGNKNPYYEVDLSRATEIDAKKEAEDKKSKRMKKINERQIRVLKELMEEQRQRITDMKIVLVGLTGSGKSGAGNMILSNELFELILPTSWLNKDQRRITCVKHEGNIDGVKVTVVETPGWFRDTTPPDWVKGQVLHSVSMCALGPQVFLLIVPVSRSFTEKDHKALVEVLMPLKERVWRHCIVLFTWGDWLNERPVEDYITSEGRYIQDLLEKCGNRYHVLNPLHFGEPVTVQQLFQKCVDMVTQNKGCFKTKNKKQKTLILPWQEKMIEEEWNRREQELIERVMKALANEPEEPAAPSVEGANSISEPPNLSGDVASESGSTSEFRNQLAHNNVVEWLRNKVGQTAISSGIGSIHSLKGYMENHEMDENHPVDMGFPQKEKELNPHTSMFSNPAIFKRRNSY